ncbi:MAG: RelA/SpoT family protein [Cytophagales bacterium]|nr:RelA/SpoT family protein [Cytophagales bacterium]MDW8384262.1 RelA/SpoT family protein [Flammeovirgaceae bacterium]
MISTGYSEEEIKTLVKMYRTLLRKMRPVLKEGDAKIIRKAFNFALEAHKNDRRKSGEPYVYHPISVAMICVEEMGLGTTSVLAALLHDVVEDTHYTIEDIREHFGEKVARIVDGLTKIKVTMSKTPTIQAENFRKVLLTIAEDARVILIKIADRLHNMRTLDSMPKDKQLKIAAETEYLYAPLAHRLGLYSIKSELEDLYLKYADPSAYEEVVSKLKNSEEARKRFIRMFSRPIEEALQKEGFKFIIKSRTKSIRSIYNKMKRQNISFEEVYDLFAIRIILQDIPYEQEKKACWTVYSIVTDFYTPNTERTRDWITIPKANGYESLHTTVMSKSGKWVEVQIRTERMDDIAEKGYAAHWKYKDKSGITTEQGIELWLNHVREMLEKNDTSAMEFMDDFRSNLFQDEIFVFTPKGEMKMLPVNASVLDFAFLVHSEIGAKCIGAKINNKLVPITHKLQNGDQVEILTSAKARPNESWLKYVVTSRARSKIKDLIKEDKKQIANYGKEIVARKLAQLKVPFGEKTIQQMMEYFNQKTEFDLFYSIGSEMIPHNEIKAFYDATQRLESTRITKRTDDASLIKKEIKALTGNDELIIGDTNGLDLEYSFAQCCRPIPGDEIFGFATSTNGIKIHRVSCPNATKLMANYSYRILKAKWASQKFIQEFDVLLHVEGTDRIGVINEITQVIANKKVNILTIDMKAHDGIFSGSIGLSVHDRAELDELIRQLENIKGIVNIAREDEITAQST